MSRGELPYISHLGMCRPEGYIIYFLAVLVRKRVYILLIFFWNRVSFSMELRGWFCFGFCDSVLSFVILFWVLRFCFEFFDSALSFVILFWVLWFCFAFCDSGFVILFWVLWFCYSVLGFVILFCASVLGFVILFWVLCFCFGFCDSVLSFVILFCSYWPP